jgi:hypothetical protein
LQGIRWRQRRIIDFNGTEKSDKRYNKETVMIDVTPFFNPFKRKQTGSAVVEVERNGKKYKKVVKRGN